MQVSQIRQVDIFDQTPPSIRNCNSKCLTEVIIGYRRAFQSMVHMLKSNISGLLIKV